MADIKARPTGESTVEVPFSREAFDDIQQMARDSGKPIERVIQESIAVNRWVNEVVRQGGKVVGEKKGRRAELKLK